DMSEFMESHQVSRLLGSPPGYIGYENAGQLTEAVRRRPYSIVLFDGIEKAHQSIFDLLLQILEDGRLTDAHGQAVDFKNTIVILTANLKAANRFSNQMSFTSARRSARTQAVEYMRTQVLAEARQMFRPELFNRLDDVIFFHPLEAEHLSQIVDLLLTRSRQRLAARGIDLQVTDEARAFLIAQDYDPLYG